MCSALYYSNNYFSITQGVYYLNEQNNVALTVIDSWFWEYLFAWDSGVSNKIDISLGGGYAMERQRNVRLMKLIYWCLWKIKK